MEGTGCSLGLWAPGSVRLSVALAFTFDFVAVEERPALVVDCIFEGIFKLLPPAGQTGRSITTVWEQNPKCGDTGRVRTYFFRRPCWASAVTQSLKIPVESPRAASDRLLVVCQCPRCPSPSQLEQSRFHVEIEV